MFNNLNRLSTLTALGFSSALWTGVALAADKPEEKKPDPRIAVMNYYGSGDSEHAPEFAEATFTFAVNCKPTAGAVTEAIEAASAPIWRTISAKVPDAAFSETEQTKWGDITNIAPRKRGSIVATPPRTVTDPNTGKPTVVKQSVKHVDLCANNAVVPFDSDLGYVFSGTQTFSVRSSDLDWVESLVKTVNKKEPVKAPDALVFSASLTRYSQGSLTKGTLEAMGNEMREKARNQATGAGSQFELDRETLKFDSARFVGSRRGFAPTYAPEIGSPVSKGKAPKVTFSLPLTYTVYAETKNLLQGEKEVGPAPSEYEVTGHAVMEADFAYTSADVFATCQPTREAAAAAVAGPASEVLAAYREIHGDAATTETDAVIDGEPSAPSGQYPYKPIQWDEKDERVVTMYLDECTGQAVAAPASRQIADLPYYWQASRSVSLKTTKFDLLVDKLSLLSGVNTTERLAAHIETKVRPATAAVVPAKANALWMAARRDANACLLDPKGALAADARAHGFVCAYVKDVRPGVRRDQQFDEAPRARGMMRADSEMMMAAAPSAPPDSLQVEMTIKPGEERPRIRMAATYEFTYEVITKDHAADFVGPKPAEEAPALP